MTFSDSFLNFLWKLHYFSRFGSVFWSVIPFPFLPLAIYFAELVELPIGTKMKILLYCILAAWVGFLVMIPQCIKRFREYTSIGISKTTLVAPQCEAPQWVHLLAPPKKIWLVAINWLVSVIVAATMAISSMDLAQAMQPMIMILTLMYLIKFGILFGSLTKTLSKECGTINTGHNLERAAYLLNKYKKFKSASKLGLFTVVSACTVLTITQSYFTITNIFCLNPGSGPLYILVGLQVSGFTLYFYMFATSADECFESFKGMAGQLR